MRFRRTFRRRRPRHGLDMIPLSICSSDITTFGGNPCNLPNSSMTLLAPLTGAETLSPSGAGDERVSTLRKGLLVRGLRFHWAVYCATQEDLSLPSLPAFYSVRVAIARMDIDSTGNPVFLPNLYSGFDQELGDILWRGAGIVTPSTNLGDYNNNVGQFVPGSYFGTGVPTAALCGSMSRSGSHSPPEHVKTARRLDKNQALFWVVNVHNPRTADIGTITFGTDFFGVAAVRSFQR